MTISNHPTLMQAIMLTVIDKVQVLIFLYPDQHLRLSLGNVSKVLPSILVQQIVVLGKDDTCDRIISSNDMQGFS